MKLVKSLAHGARVASVLMKGPGAVKKQADTSVSAFFSAARGNALICCADAFHRLKTSRPASKASGTARRLVGAGKQFANRLEREIEFSRRTGKTLRRTITFDGKPVSKMLTAPLAKIAKRSATVVSHARSALPSAPNLVKVAGRAADAVATRISHAHSALQPDRSSSRSVSKAQATATARPSRPGDADPTRLEGRIETFQINPDLHPFQIDIENKQMGASIAAFLKFGTHNV